MIKMAHKYLKNQRGVTLVEMLAVIVIIGIVAGVAVPAVVGQIDSAKVATDDSNLQVLNDAVDRYYIMEGSYPTGDAAAVIALLQASGNNGGPYIDTDFPTTLQQDSSVGWTYTAATHTFSYTITP